MTQNASAKPVKFFRKSDFLIAMLLLLVAASALYFLYFAGKTEPWLPEFSRVMLIMTLIVTVVVSMKSAMRLKGLLKVDSPRLLGLLGEIEPDQLFTARKFVVARKGEIHVLAQWPTFVGFYFLKFGHSSATGSSKVKLPKRIPPFKARRVIEGIPVARLEGRYVIPVRATKVGNERYSEVYMEGTGLLYFASRFDVERSRRAVDQYGRFSKNSILRIIDEISKEKVRARPF